MIVQGSVLGKVTHNLKVLGRSPRRAGALRGAGPNGVRILSPLHEYHLRSSGWAISPPWGLMY
jgi:hypothetical protein